MKYLLLLASLQLAAAQDSVPRGVAPEGKASTKSLLESTHGLTTINDTQKYTKEQKDLRIVTSS